jgi:hypothetical protein
MNFAAIIDYLKQTEELGVLPGAEGILSTISDWYARLSRFTHLHNANYMGFPTINQPSSTDVDLSLLQKASESLWLALLVLLVVFFTDGFLNASPAEQKLVRDALGTPLRRMVAEYLRKIA